MFEDVLHGSLDRNALEFFDGFLVSNRPATGARAHPSIHKRRVEELLVAAGLVDSVEMVSSKAGEVVPGENPHGVEFSIYICISPFRTPGLVGNPEGQEDVVVVDQKSRQRSLAVLPF